MGEAKKGLLEPRGREGEAERKRMRRDLYREGRPAGAVVLGQGKQPLTEVPSRKWEYKVQPHFSACSDLLPVPHSGHIHPEGRGQGCSLNQSAKSRSQDTEQSREGSGGAGDVWLGKLH